MSVCSNGGRKYEVKVERVDRAPFLVAQNLVGMSDKISPGSSSLKFDPASIAAIRIHASNLRG
jgi:hypothetical protein